jgi:hypothetical protein
MDGQIYEGYKGNYSSIFIVLKVMMRSAEDTSHFLKFGRMKSLIFLGVLFFAIPVSAQHTLQQRGALGKYFTQKDSALLTTCECDSIVPVKDLSSTRLSADGSGLARLYDLEKLMSKCGYFERYELLYGFDYIYDKEKKPVRVDRYFKGKKIGECEIK